MPLLVRMLGDESNLPGRFDAIGVLGLLGPAARRRGSRSNQGAVPKTHMTEGELTLRVDQAAAWALGQIGPGESGDF